MTGELQQLQEQRDEVEGDITQLIGEITLSQKKIRSLLNEASNLNHANTQINNAIGLRQSSGGDSSPSKPKAEDIPQNINISDKAPQGGTSGDQGSGGEIWSRPAEAPAPVQGGGDSLLAKGGPGGKPGSSSPFTSSPDSSLDSDAALVDKPKNQGVASNDSDAKPTSNINLDDFPTTDSDNNSVRATGQPPNDENAISRQLALLGKDYFKPGGSSLGKPSSKQKGLASATKSQLKAKGKGFYNLRGKRKKALNNPYGLGANLTTAQRLKLSKRRQSLAHFRKTMCQKGYCQKRGLASVSSIFGSKESSIFYSMCMHYKFFEMKNNIKYGETRCPQP